MMITAIRCCDGSRNNQSFGVKPTLRPNALVTIAEDTFKSGKKVEAKGKVQTKIGGDDDHDTGPGRGDGVG